MAPGEPPVLVKAESVAQRLKGWLFAALMFFSALFGSFYVLVPLSPLCVLSPYLFRNLADRMIGLWLILPSGLLRWMYNAKVRVTGDAVEHSEPALIIMNHRTRLDWLFFWSALYQQDPWLLTSEKISLKGILKYIPGAGWAMQINAFIFLKRSFDEDREKLRKLLEYYSKVGMNYQVLLFPEGTDKCCNATERSRLFAEKNKLVHYDYVLHPRVTGFVYIVQQMRKLGYIKYIYDVTVGFGDVIVQSEVDLVKEGLVPANVHYQIRKLAIDELPESDEALGKWLIELWASKEEKLKKFYTRPSKDDTFENTPTGKDWPMSEVDDSRQKVIVIAWLTVTFVWALGYLFLPLQWVYSLFCIFIMVFVHHRFNGWEWLCTKTLDAHLAATGRTRIE